MTMTIAPTATREHTARVIEVAAAALAEYGPEGLTRENVYDHDGLTCDTLGAEMATAGLGIADAPAVIEALVAMLPAA